MKIRITQLRQRLDDWQLPPEELAARALRVKRQDILWARLARKSVDARDKGDVHFTLTLELETARPVHLPKGAEEMKGNSPSQTASDSPLEEGASAHRRNEAPSQRELSSGSLTEGVSAPQGRFPALESVAQEIGNRSAAADGIERPAIEAPHRPFGAPPHCDGEAFGETTSSDAALPRHLPLKGKAFGEMASEDVSPAKEDFCALTSGAKIDGRSAAADGVERPAIEAPHRPFGAPPHCDGEAFGETTSSDAALPRHLPLKGKAFGEMASEDVSPAKEDFCALTSGAKIDGRKAAASGVERPALEAPHRPFGAPPHCDGEAFGETTSSDAALPRHLPLKGKAFGEMASEDVFPTKEDFCALTSGAKIDGRSAAADGIERPALVVGMGPAGLFAALTLARAGLRPVVVERGKCVEEREKDVAAFWNGGPFDPRSNVQFGEGGAGTFSDGKLNSGIKDPRCRAVLEEMHRAGAPESILWQAKPHVGTDHLKTVVRHIRQEIIALGGDVRFETRLAGLRVEDGRVTGAILEGPEGAYALDTGAVILAVGHSARDTFEMLHETGTEMSRKPFAIGARIEHRQAWINRAQYGPAADHPALGAADYKLAVHLPGGRSAYTFCMCPGGQVVAAASEAGGVVVNGMSLYARDGENANAALLANVLPEDFGGEGPLAGVEFQRKWERAAFEAGGGDYRAPAQKVGDFLNRRPSEGPGKVTPSYRPGVKWGSLDGCLPGFVTEAMREALPLLDRKLKGFAHPDAVLTGVETRSSSPVRIERGADCQSNLAGLYPCGEGAGYAGGIMSAAVDGMKVAEKVICGRGNPSPATTTP